MKNAPPVLENLNLISFQFTVYNQEKLLYFEPLMITVVEVNKLFGHADVFASDRSRLAQCLRAIDTLNCETDFGEFVTDPVFRVLQEEVKLCNFSSRYLMTDEMKSIDRAMYAFMKQEQIARNFLKDGLDPKVVARNTELPLYWVIDLKKKMELAEV